MHRSLLKNNEERECANWVEPIAEDLKLVEMALRDASSSKVLQLTQASSNLIEGGGKRIRPSLVLLWSLALGGLPGDSARVLAASAVELIHMATLMHDDVIDRADLRRGRLTANASWGNKVSILTGDFLLSKAFDALVRLQDLRVFEILPQVTAAMSESEALQALNERNIEGWREHYWQIIHGKTAGFIAACCEMGAIISGADNRKRELARVYGENLGLAFQITDDLLDLVSSSSTVGKPTGSDLRDGKITLPVLLALENCESQEKEKLSALVVAEQVGDEAVEEIRAVARRNGAVEKTRAEAANRVEEACAALSEIEDSAAKKSLICLAEQIVSRTF